MEISNLPAALVGFGALITGVVGFLAWLSKRKPETTSITVGSAERLVVMAEKAAEMLERRLAQITADLETANRELGQMRQQLAELHRGAEHDRAWRHMAVDYIRVLLSRLAVHEVPPDAPNGLDLEDLPPDPAHP